VCEKVSNVLLDAFSASGSGVSADVSGTGVLADWFRQLAADAMTAPKTNMAFSKFFELVPFIISTF